MSTRLALGLRRGVGWLQALFSGALLDPAFQAGAEFVRNVVSGWSQQKTSTCKDFSGTETRISTEFEKELKRLNQTNESVGRTFNEIIEISLNNLGMVAEDEKIYWVRYFAYLSFWWRNMEGFGLIEETERCDPKKYIVRFTTTTGADPRELSISITKAASEGVQAPIESAGAKPASVWSALEEARRQEAEAVHAFRDYLKSPEGRARAFSRQVAKAISEGLDNWRRERREAEGKLRRAFQETSLDLEAIRAAVHKGQARGLGYTDHISIRERVVSLEHNRELPVECRAMLGPTSLALEEACAALGSEDDAVRALGLEEQFSDRLEAHCIDLIKKSLNSVWDTYNRYLNIYKTNWAKCRDSLFTDAIDYDDLPISIRDNELWQEQVRGSVKIVVTNTAETRVRLSRPTEVSSVDPFESWVVGRPAKGRSRYDRGPNVIKQRAE